MKGFLSQLQGILIYNEGMGLDRFTDWLELEVKDRGWSFEELGRRAHVSSGHLSKIRTGAQLPTWEVSVRIAYALKMPPEVVFRKAGLLPPLPSTNDLSPEAQADIDEIRRTVAMLSPEAQERVTEQLINLARMAADLAGAELSQESAA